MLAAHFKPSPTPGIPTLVAGLRKHAAPCECGSCELQFVRMELQHIDVFRYENIITPATAKTSLDNFVDQITSDRAYLADVCLKYGNTIVSRWRKKSREKRETLLLQADPTIEKEAWFRLRTEEDEISWQDVRQYRRRSFLLPYFSTAMMKTNPLVLLGLLHHRVHHSPEEWAPFDSDIIRRGWTSGALGLEYCGHYCVVMNGVDYGKLVPWSKAAAERWDIVGYPRARLIIESQALLFSRLRSIVDLILEGVNRDTASVSEKWQEMVQAGFNQINNIELWSDYINQPFSSPPQFDVDYYCSVAKARMQAAQDNLWLLQTDPSYVRRFIKILAAGRMYKTAWRHKFIAEDIHQAMRDYLRWREVDEEWSVVRDYYRRYRDSIHPGQPLPPRLELSLAFLEFALLASMDKKVKRLCFQIAQRPGFQHKWEITMSNKYKSGSGQEGMTLNRTCKKSNAQLYRDDPLDWTLMNLQGHPDAEHRHDHVELFAKLEAHLAEANPEERARLDETIYEKLSDFAAQHEMLTAVRSHRPAFQSRGLEDSLKMLKDNSTAFTRSLVPNAEDVKPHQFPEESIRRFEQSTPAIGRKNKTWLDCRTAERKALNMFWDGASAALRQEFASTRMNEGEINDILLLVSVSKSTEYAELVERERLQVSNAIETEALAKNAASVLTQHDPFPDASPNVSRLVIEERAPKPKTRPSQPVNKAAPPEIPIVAHAEPAGQQHIPATPRVLEIIKKMFPNFAEEISVKDTDWDLFVHAMNDLNFKARNVGGSAVAFEHPSKKKIIFHRPHPVAKIDSIMLQSMGKRLKKHFDWIREAFIGV
ncbi:hypothetical protein KCU78_g7214, partial [Aureobasidium melanogenum]